MYKAAHDPVLLVFLQQQSDCQMITSSNFFRKTLFYTEQKSQHQQPLPSIKKNAISPWQPQEDLPTDLFGDPKRTTKKQKQQPKQQTKRQIRTKKNAIKSNLLNVSIEQKPITNPIIDPPLTKIKRVPVTVKCRVEDSKKKNENSYDSMSIREFLNKQRLQIIRLREANRETIQNGESARNFFVKRNYRKMRSTDEQIRTLDLKRELLQPLQVFERKSVLAINPRSKLRQLQFYLASTGKSNPLYEHRYSLD